jgi:outer membrane protein assembly factor BamA
VRQAVVVFALIAAATPSARAAAAVIAGIRMTGKTKVTPHTALILARVHVGDPVTPDLTSRVQEALLSSELFKSVKVTLEQEPGGVVIVANVVDKMSWIAAPTVYVLPSSYAFGAGYAENDLFGQNRKLLLYGQLGNLTSLFFGTYLDPSVRGSRLQLRFDLYLLHHVIDEYANPENDPRSLAIDRESTETYLDAGALVGWRFAWWLVGDLRLRGAHVAFRNAHAVDAAKTPLPTPERDGWDVAVQAELTADRRQHLFGVTWGPYVQLHLESSVPELDSYGYQVALLRAYYSWVLFDRQELELRTNVQIGRHLPFNEELTEGGVTDLRGYALDQFRGDFRTLARAEYSVPLFTFRMFALRAITFWDSGFVGNYFHDPSGKRDYLPSQAIGDHWLRNDVGAGLRVYVSSVVLPLLGLDFGYGLEAHNPEVYFEVGLTDF